ncbi:MAG: molecular chaperone HtpG [Alphaproteobacteria bacterium]
MSQTKKTDKPEKHVFQAEVSKLLNIVTHALYSDKQIFLRELMSNASDACDRLRYAGLTDETLLKGIKEFKITITTNPEKKTLTIHDNGIGMTKEDLISNLGTIARSGTENFLKSLGKDEKGETNLIGQFGVGFYAAFMVADRVEVITKRAGTEDTWHWESAGTGAFEIEPAVRDQHGTTIILHMKEDEEEYLAEQRIAYIVKRYSDHVPYVISLLNEVGEGKDAVSINLNEAKALWTRQKSEVDDAQYNTHYQQITGAGTDEKPWMTLHARVEGMIDYTCLLYIPSKKPLDLFNPDRVTNVALYVKRVLISEHCQDLIPGYLRFLRGVVDSESVSLNVSREMLQKDPALGKIKKALIKRVLGELKKQQENNAEEFLGFWENFGAVLKEGVYEDYEARERILDLSLFHQTAGKELISLEKYVAEMKDGQDAIYFITGEDAADLMHSPQLEGFVSKGINVLLLTDAIDDFWVNAIGEHKGVAFKSITKGASDLDAFDEKAIEGEKKEKKAPTKAVQDLLPILSDILKEHVKEVRVSERMKNSAVCLVADESDMDLRLTELLKNTREIDTKIQRILEVNPQHRLVKKLAKIAKEPAQEKIVKEMAFLLLDQAFIVEGVSLPSRHDFSERFLSVLEKSLS